MDGMNYREKSGLQSDIYRHGTQVPEADADRTDPAAGRYRCLRSRRICTTREKGKDKSCQRKKAIEYVR